ncbi:glycosyltransferase family 39 protein [Pseudobutyrivibrio sp.]|uniref:glycosyltransferase family 39 protein n=1 Tax=Pseudobutyrivibrio sp. TaxID=2014367 RepID=UPI00386DF95A
MLEAIDNKKIIFKVIIGIFVLVWSFNVLNVGFYVDENGLLSIYKGFYQGQRLFTDSWEALQTGGILAYPLLALYYQVLAPLFAGAGFNIGLVLYMRIVYTICRLLVAIYLYFTIRKTVYEDGAFAASIFYYMFVMGWKNFSYKSYCDLAIMLLICFIIRFQETKKNWYFIFAGIATCVAILAYPTMIIMAFAITALLIVGIYRNEIQKQCLAFYIITCFVIGIAVVVYIQCTSGLGNVINQIGNLGDQDYENGLLYRLGVLLVSYLVFAVIAYLPICAIAIIRRFRYVSEVAEAIVLTLYWFGFLAAVCLVRISSVSNSRFIYAILILFFWFPYLAFERKDNEFTRIGAYNNTNSDELYVLWVMFAVSAVSQFVWSLSTNQDITVPGHMAVYVVVADILIITRNKELLAGLVGLINFVALFFMGFWVAEHNGGYEDVLSLRYMVTEGELKGIILLPEDYDANEICYRLVTENLTEDDRLLVAFGSNSTGYLNSNAKQGTYSVYARTQLNTKLIDYYKINPQNQADYLLLDKGNPKYERFLEYETGKYLMETYSTIVAEDGNYVLLSK